MFSVPHQQLLDVAARIKNNINPKILIAEQNMWRRESQPGKSTSFSWQLDGKSCLCSYHASLFPHPNQYQLSKSTKGFWLCGPDKSYKTSLGSHFSLSAGNFVDPFLLASTSILHVKVSCLIQHWWLVDKRGFSASPDPLHGHYREMCATDCAFFQTALSLCLPRDRESSLP